jgi:hypothetical protein
MVFTLTSLVGFTLDWLDFLVGITILNLESCYAAANPSAEASGTRVVEVYPIAS